MDRFEGLFADLSGELDAALAAEAAAEVAERTRSDLGSVDWAARVRASVGRELTVWTDAGELTGRLVESGVDWLRLAQSAGSVLVAAAAVAGLEGLDRIWSADPPSRIESAVDLRFVLRRLVRDRAALEVATAAGTVTGTADAVGADWLELAEHPYGEWRRAEAVYRRRVVPIAAVRWVRAPAG